MSAPERPFRVKFHSEYLLYFIMAVGPLAGLPHFTKERPNCGKLFDFHFGKGFAAHPAGCD